MKYLTTFLTLLILAAGSCFARVSPDALRHLRFVAQDGTIWILQTHMEYSGPKGQGRPLYDVLTIRPLRKGVNSRAAEKEIARVKLDKNLETDVQLICLISVQEQRPGLLLIHADNINPAGCLLLDMNTPRPGLPATP